MPKKIFFKDHPEFTPNLSPREIFKLGSFGGTYWRPIYSSITQKKYENQHLEFPSDWWKGIDDDMLISSKCDVKKNKYGVKSGSSLKDWEDSGWIVEQDPYGWVQWYCRFYNGRRSADDTRQIDRWLKFAGPKGRFRNRLINLIKKKRADVDDFTISPVIRQGLQHWAFKLQKEHIKN